MLGLFLGHNTCLPYFWEMIEFPIESPPITNRSTRAFWDFRNQRWIRDLRGFIVA